MYISIQKNKHLNWVDTKEHELIESQQKALECSATILRELYTQFPITEKYHNKFTAHFESKSTSSNQKDTSFIYGKWMRNNPEEEDKDSLKNFTEKVKKAEEEKAKTILKSNAVEEIISVQIDQK